uniref:Putative glutamine amidotransferase domain-containing protein n=1 Tax=Schlesneria paludicola TaxID=360056 RepID=A0A7C4QVJ6_9PLAN
MAVMEPAKDLVVVVPADHEASGTFGVRGTMVLAALLFAQPAWLAPVALLAFLAAVLLFWQYRRLGRESAGWVLVGVAKWLALVLLAMCLAEPLWSSQRARPGANLFLLVADNSQSLTLTDADETTPRGVALKKLLTNTSAAWHVRLEQDFEVRRYQFDGAVQFVTDFQRLDFRGDRSELGGVLRSLRQRLKDRPVAGMLLFTDGNATDDIRPEDWAGLPPVYPVPIGRGDRQRDLAVSNVAVTTTAFEDAPVTLQVELSHLGLAGQTVVLRVADEAGKTLKDERLTLEDAEVAAVTRFQLRPTAPGVTFYRVHAALEENAAAAAVPEATLENNTRLVVVDRGAGPYRLLYVSGRPNWEFKFFRRALQTDDQLSLTGLLRIAKKEAKFDFRGREGETANPLFRGFDRVDEDTERHDQPVLVRIDPHTPDELRDGFPKTAEQLYRYHAVILDDLEAEFFTAEQLSLLERFVSERGGGLLVLGGQESFRQGNYHKPPLSRLLPVYLDAVQTAPPAAGYRLALTREGWLQPWARLRSTEAEELLRLRQVPGLLAHNTVSGVKPGASVIAEVVDPQGRKQPALVYHRFGQGRCAALLVGDLWRWQLGQTDELREKDDLGKAWRQLLRWLIVDVPSRVELHADVQHGASSPVVKLTARVRDAEFHPQDNAGVALKVLPPEAPALVLPAEASLDEPGVYTAVVANRPAGAWRATVDVTDAEGNPLGQAATGWSADPAAHEFRRVAPDRELLARLAKDTGGKMVELADLEAFTATLSSRSAPIEETATTPLWHHPLIWLAILAGLCSEWAYRRSRGLP